MDRGNCRSCGAEILWALTVNGKRMPVDPEPCREGNLILRADGVAEAAPAPMETAVPIRHRSHFATCPKAGQHRKAR